MAVALALHFGAAWVLAPDWRRVVEDVTMAKMMLAMALIVAGYLGAAFDLAPDWWRAHERGRLPSGELLTVTAADIPGDPLNLAVEGTEGAILAAFAAAGWRAADPVTMRSAIGIGLSVLLDRADPTAPVSPLFYLGRRQDLAFEKAAGRSADQRHHLRLWRIEGDGVPLWLGAASFDRGVGLSHDTGEITHHIGPDLDAERDGVVADLVATGQVESRERVEGVAVREGRNGGGDPYRTDGAVAVVVLSAP